MKVAEKGVNNSMRNSEWCRKLVPKMRWSMSEGAMNAIEWWWWFDESDVRWRACVVTMRRLNTRYEVIEIRWLSGIENFVSERDNFIFNSFGNFKPVKRFRVHTLIRSFVQFSHEFSLSYLTAGISHECRKVLATMTHYSSNAAGRQWISTYADDGAVLINITAAVAAAIDMNSAGSQHLPIHGSVSCIERDTTTQLASRPNSMQPTYNRWRVRDGTELKINSVQVESDLYTVCDWQSVRPIANMTGLGCYGPCFRQSINQSISGP